MSVERIMSNDGLREFIYEFEFEGKRIPHRMIPIIINYIQHGVCINEFILHLLAKDFEAALTVGDSKDLFLIPVYYHLFRELIGEDIWGNAAKVKTHMCNKGRVGQ